MLIVCVHSANYGKLPVFNSEKAPRELGIKWTPIRTTLQEMAARELKLVRIVSPVLQPDCLLPCQPDTVRLTRRELRNELVLAAPGPLNEAGLPSCSSPGLQR